MRVCFKIFLFLKEDGLLLLKGGSMLIIDIIKLGLFSLLSFQISSASCFFVNFFFVNHDS